MSKKVFVFFADGFETVEGLMVVDLLRRAELDVVTVSIKDTVDVETSAGVAVKADRVFAGTDFADADLLVLPGGQPGTTYLSKYQPLLDLLKKQYEAGRMVAAICAAPTVLGGLGFLKDRRATCYPALLNTLDCKERCEEPVVVDGNVTTSRGLGTAADFGLCLIAQLLGSDKAREIAESVVYHAAL
ncbi:MAG: DJ-1/PfpI family protein [Blautia sp.]|nr:DJ-1/PfpI family protein [Blautia sp.]